MKDSRTPRRSSRDRRPTEKGEEYIRTISAKRHQFSLEANYQNWKKIAKITRTNLKVETSEGDALSLTAQLEQSRREILRNYEEIKISRTPSREEVKKVDCVTAITDDFLEASMKIRALETFDPEVSKFHVRTLLPKADFPSVSGNSVTETEPSVLQDTVFESQQSHVGGEANSDIPESDHSVAAADLAIKQAEVQALEEVQSQKRKVREEEEKLEMIKTISKVKIAETRVNSLEGYENVDPRNKHAFKKEIKSEPDATKHTTTKLAGESQLLMNLLQDNVSLSRLPVPEPFVFSGGPPQFNEWKSSFHSLIERKNITLADKLFYLRKYNSGSAANVIKGSFLRSDDAAYKDAWNRLNSRFGDTFLIQHAYRDKLAKWPKIPKDDGFALREFADFLSSCNDAIQQVKGLEILNDCEENRKLVSKLPNWLKRSWNRVVSTSLKSNVCFSFR